MVFSSLTFLYLFLPIVFFSYYISNIKIKNLILFVSGVVFYAWGEPVFVLTMLLTIVIDYTCGRLIDRCSDQKKRIALLVVSVVINLLLLAIFKYNSFFVQNLNALFGLSIPDPHIPLPIGISFYTFQSMSYTIDLYRRNIRVQKNFIHYASYVTLFPQIVAGPIVRYEDVQNEIDNRKITVSMVSDGIGIFLRGLAKKILLANNIGALWTVIKAQPADELSVLTAWMGILAFTFQIYYDFSGYSDMAVGMGKMLGFHFPENFNFPYIAKSVSEFWRRWHITLGSWFKSYVYFPLGGNRKGKWRTIFNLLVVWMLTGFWHGASWNFILWGLYFGVLIICEKLFLGRFLERLPSFFSMLYTFLIVVFGWVLFEFDQMGKVWQYFGAMFGQGNAGWTDSNAMYYLASFALIFILCVFFAGPSVTRWWKKIKERLPRTTAVLVPIVQAVTLVICTAYLVDATYNPFLYFRF